MKLDCSSYHLIFMLFLLQGGFDVQEKVFGLVKVKLDSLDAAFVESFPTFDIFYFVSFAISSILFWRLPWSCGFRKVAIVSLTLRSLLYFCCLLSPSESPYAFSAFLWATQGFLQGLLQAPLTALILLQYKNMDDGGARGSDYRWSFFTFMVGILSSIMAFISAPNVADETLCSTLITVGLLVVNVLNYVVCFFPYDQVDISMSTLINSKDMTQVGSPIRRFCSSIVDCLRDFKTTAFDRRIFSLSFAIAMASIVRYFMFWRMPLELYYRVLFPAPPFQLMYLSGACMFEIIGLIGACILFVLRTRLPGIRNFSTDRPFGYAALCLLVGIPLFTPIIADVDKIEDSYKNMSYLMLYIVGIVLTYFARIVLMGPSLLKAAEAMGNPVAVISTVYALSNFALAFAVFLGNSLPIEGLIERGIPFAVIGGVSSLYLFVSDVYCKQHQSFVVGGVAYRPLIIDNSVNP